MKVASLMIGWFGYLRNYQHGCHIVGIIKDQLLLLQYNTLKPM